MPSIIDAIQNAEKNAAEIKKEALLSARQVVLLAEKQENTRFEEALAKEREELFAAREAAEKEGETIKNTILQDKTDEARAIGDTAAKKSDKAVGFILSKIKTL